MKILILCTGNSCRSQMAQGFLQSFDSELQVFSAGINPAEKVNPMAIEVMKNVNIDLSRNLPMNVAVYQNESWDYVITVCGNANENCPTFNGSVKKRLHIGFDDPFETKGTSEFMMSEFIRVRDEIKNGMAKFYFTEIKGMKMPNCICNSKN